MLKATVLLQLEMTLCSLGLSLPVHEGPLFETDLYDPRPFFCSERNPFHVGSNTELIIVLCYILMSRLEDLICIPYLLREH